MNRESERKRLVELCENVVMSCKSSLCADCEHNKVDYPHCMSEHFADHLLANGIVVPPVKVGQKVYIITEVSKTITEVAVIGVWQCASNTAIITEVGTIHQNSIGKTVFLTREEAEKMLKGEGE